MHNADRSSFDAVDEKRRLEARERERVLRAGLPGADMSEEDLGSARMQVDGRAQDFGPVSLVPGDEEGMLPPDYRQATEYSVQTDIE